jgi:hypothetical protein
MSKKRRKCVVFGAFLVSCAIAFFGKLSFYWTLKIIWVALWVAVG